MDGGSWYCTEGSDQDHPEGREMKTDKMVVWGGLTESCERKRSKRQRRKGKIYPFSSVVVSTLCDPLDCSTPGLPVRHQLLEFTQTHVHWVGEAIKPSHPLICPLLLPPSIFPSIRVLSNESVLRIRWMQSSHLNAEFQRIARRDKKAFLSDQCKEIEENNRMGD